MPILFRSQKASDEVMIDLKFDKVSKRYRVRQELPQNAARNPVLRKIQSLRLPSQDFWAVRDVSFEVPRGEALGIIGHNGAGKSTILKLLANITTPTAGEITINGRLSALIEVGSGFHPELTGRENIYLNGSILGMRRHEISEKLDSIADFAGVRQFLDTPVKRFSSGMYVRLGFSIAAHLDPDILLLDEVLAVGDAAFQAKCLKRISDLKKAGTTIVFISHDLGAVEQTCDRVLLMQQGEILCEGLPDEVITEYHRVSSSNSQPSKPNSTSSMMADEPKKFEMSAVTFCDWKGHRQKSFRTGEPFKAIIDFTAQESFTDIVFELFINSSEGPLQCQFTTEQSREQIDIEPGLGRFEFSCAELGLKAGLYFIDVEIKLRESVENLAFEVRCATLHVDPGKPVRGGLFYMPHDWRLLNEASRLAITDNNYAEDLLEEFVPQI